jgi:hypothetical protein
VGRKRRSFANQPHRNSEPRATVLRFFKRGAWNSAPDPFRRCAIDDCSIVETLEACPLRCLTEDGRLSGMGILAGRRQVRVRLHRRRVASLDRSPGYAVPIRSPGAVVRYNGCVAASLSSISRRQAASSPLGFRDCFRLKILGGRLLVCLPAKAEALRALAARFRSTISLTRATAPLASTASRKDRRSRWAPSAHGHPGRGPRPGAYR